jgi:hypothetical protein
VCGKSFDSFLDFSCIGLLLGEKNLTSGCHVNSNPDNFLSPICSPTGEAGKHVQTGLPQVFSVDLRLATVVYMYTYSGESKERNFHSYSEGELLKNRSF